MTGYSISFAFGKRQKTFYFSKKGVDKIDNPCYYIQALRETKAKQNMGEWWNW